MTEYVAVRAPLNRPPVRLSSNTPRKPAPATQFSSPQPAGTQQSAVDVFTPTYTGADPASVIAAIPAAMKAINTITLDATAIKSGVPESVVRPVSCFLYTETHIVQVMPDGSIAGVHEQGEKPGTKPVMIDAPYVLLRESRSGRVWFVGTVNGAPAIRTLPGYGAKPMPDQPPGESVVVAYMPGVGIPDALVKSLRARRRAQPGTRSAPPPWADKALRDLRRRRKPSSPGGEHDRTGAGDRGTGPGAGEKGTGAGGGGSGERTTGPGGGDERSPKSTTADEKADEKDAQAGRPLKGAATYRIHVGADGKPTLRITIDRATTSIPLREGEADSALDARVDAAEKALQQSRDPDSHKAVRKGATTTGFVTPKGAVHGTAQSAEEATAQAQATPWAVAPGERVPGARGGANAAPYPSKITMAGVPEDAEVPKVSVAGSTNEFTMTLDYAALSVSFQDETFRRMQNVEFYWELIDVTNLTAAQAQEKRATTKVGGGEAQQPIGALSANLSRDMRAVAADQEADRKMMREEDWPWEARAAYLTVIGLSNTVRVLGSIIGSFIDRATQPLNARSIGFSRRGDFLVRCVATPQVSDEARADPEHHTIRASSVAVMPIRIAHLGERATEAVEEEPRKLAQLQAALELARASGDPAAIAKAQEALDNYRRGAALGGVATYRNRLAEIRRQIEVARALERHEAAGTPNKEWSDDEVSLRIDLYRRNMTPTQYLVTMERALENTTAQGHPAWIEGQLGKFVPVNGRSDFRPRLVLASEETGQVSEILCSLGELKGSGDGHWRWALLDMTSPGTRDVYEGTSTLAGPTGRAAAIRDAFRNFAENAEYGRGVLAIRLPADLIEAIGPVPIERQMVSAPGSRGRALQRLKDLATVAEIAGLFVAGPAGLVVGMVGGVAGAVVAVDSLAKRARTGHLVDVGTVFDALGVLGGVASVLRVGNYYTREALEAAAHTKPPRWISGMVRTNDDVLHMYGKFENVQQIVSLPVQFALEWAEINKMDIPDREKDAHRLRAILNALRTGAITIASMRGGADPEPVARAGATTGGAAEAPAAPGARERAQQAAESGRAPTVEPSTVAPVHPGTEPTTAARVEAAGKLATERLGSVKKAEIADAARRAASEDSARRSAEDPAHTAVGTPRGPAPEQAGAVRETNAAERLAAVDLLGRRMGQERPLPHPGGGKHPPKGEFGQRTRTASEAVLLYDHAVAASGGRVEVGLFYNPHTGEFAVMVGTEHEVGHPAGEQFAWRALVHLHPNPENVIVRRLPAPRDVELAMIAAAATGTHIEYVQSTRPDGSTGLAKVTVTLNPRRIVVEMPAGGGEPARRIEVASPEAYAREYSRDSTYLDPASPDYAWVMRDIADFYRNREAESGPLASEGPRTATGTVRGGGDSKPAGAQREPIPAPSAVSPSHPTAGHAGDPAAPRGVREELSARRPDVAARFAEADRAFAEAGSEGTAPSATFDAAMAALHQAGMGHEGRAAVERLLAPGAGQQELGITRLRDVVAAMHRVAEVVGQRPELLTKKGRDDYRAEVGKLADDVSRSHENGRTLDGTRLSTPDSPELAATIADMKRAVRDDAGSPTTDPVARLLELMALRDRVARAGETLRSYGPRFSSSLPYVAPNPSHRPLVKGVADRRITVAAEGVVTEPLARDLPGLGLEQYMLPPRALRDLPTQQTGLGRRLARLLRGWHRAHLIGPGFGTELFTGMMLAPEHVNLTAQNKGVEAFIRAAADNRHFEHVDVKAEAQGRRLEVPLTDGSVEHVDILTRIEYKITVTVKGVEGQQATRTHRVIIDVGPPPGGAVRVHSTIPPTATGGDVLATLPQLTSPPPYRL